MLLCYIVPINRRKEKYIIVPLVLWFSKDEHNALSQFFTKTENLLKLVYIRS
jgi:hypothetical protein